MSTTKLRVDFEPLGKRIDVSHGTNLLEAARLAGIQLTTDCGGVGSCGQCLVIAREGGHALSQLSITEQILFNEDEQAQGHRLACQANVLDDVKIDIPLASLISEQRLQIESKNYLSAARLAPEDRVMQSYRVSLSEPGLHDQRSDLERVLGALAKDEHRTGLSASPIALQALPSLLRKFHWQIQVLVREDAITAFMAPDSRPVGLAVDLGTTKIAAYLVDMLTGETLAAEGRPNPQIGYGEDVVSRMGYVLNNPQGAKTLAMAICSTLAELAQELAARVNLSTQDIIEGCIVGNTAMMHILLELPVRQLASAPYIPVTTLPNEVRAVDLGLPFAGDARVYLPACVAGYIGADLVAMTYASGIGQDERAVLGIDIGTNTEIILSTGSRRGAARMFSLSCASGPAFEGAHIKAGMRAAAGAIERVWLENGKTRVQTIGNVPPIGICGSGIIDAVAEMRRSGLINSRGRLSKDSPKIHKEADGLAFLLLPEDETGTGEAITITQNDVNEIQFAKGAIKAGITILMEIGGLQFDDLDEIVLAGAFGSYLNLDTATAIGLLPNIPLEKYRQIGNAAGDGARWILVSAAARNQTAQMARQIGYVELATYPGFQRIYAESMSLNE